ncbi:glutathione S-transferase [Povalibacter uvarum]|uniref:Glutathione S-transferase n=1 Tax=Povalibacter uvarum TaxID=732238 RepID=A0A841HPX9_9GAMM|nr:glutathione S-transferase family protein [Povalibacter uvarum]MBB6094823.1 glutathione S-transferase [Povalibacter uvarum]
MLSLVIGNKQLSSWSLRPWLVLRHLEIAFREIPLTLDVPSFGPAIQQYSAAGRVPVLVDGDLGIWDSLAIIEYLHEKSAGRAWPSDPAQRAHARSISAEMHSGFAALRQSWPLQAATTGLRVPLSPEGRKDVARIDELWQDCRRRHRNAGPWLFGKWSAADAFYAPVVLRFRSYGASVSEVSAAYVSQTLADPSLIEWIAAAEEEIAA